MSHSFAMQVQMQASDGRGDDLAAIMIQAANAVKNMPGCQAFVVMQGMSNPDQVMITEIWDDQADHQASLKNPEIKTIINAARSLIAHMEHQVGRPLTGLS